MQTKLVNLRLSEDEIKALDKLAGKALNRQAVARMLLIAAIEAVELNQGRLDLPPRLSVSPAEGHISYRTNEPTKSRLKNT